MEMLLQERYHLMRFLGVQHSEWQRMTKWERVDLLYRFKEEQKKRAQDLRAVPKKKRFFALVQAALSRVVFR